MVMSVYNPNTTELWAQTSTSDLHKCKCICTHISICTHTHTPRSSPVRTRLTQEVYIVPGKGSELPRLLRHHGGSSTEAERKVCLCMSTCVHTCASVCVYVVCLCVVYMCASVHVCAHVLHERKVEGETVMGRELSKGRENQRRD